MPEEDIVSLVVEGHHLSAPELWVMVEESSKHPSNHVTKSSGEVVQDHLRSVGGHPTVTLVREEHTASYMFSNPTVEN